MTTPDINELYHENSKMMASDIDLFSWIRLVTGSDAFHQTLSRPFKRYRGKRRVALPPLPVAGTDEGGAGFIDVALRRRSVRAFHGAAPVGAVAKMLQLAYAVMPSSVSRDGRRPAPSAGGLYPLELYLFAFAVEGLPAGLYHYSPPDNVLEELSPGDWHVPLGQMSFSENAMSGAAGVFAITGLLRRTQFKYRKRAYRFMMLEAGHVAQNIMLAAVAAELATFGLGGFLDDELNDLLGIDGEHEAALYLVPFGRPDTTRTVASSA